MQSSSELIQEQQLDAISEYIKTVGTYEFLTQVDAYKLIIVMLKMKPEIIEVIFSGFNDRTRKHFEADFKNLTSSDDEIEKAIFYIYEFMQELISEIEISK